MDKLTPLELERIRLRRTFRGYERKAVDRLLQRAKDEIESLIIENEQLKIVQRETDKRLSSFEEQEAILRDSIVMAQKAAEDARSSAAKEAELLVESARQEASRKQQIAISEREDLLKEIEQIAKERDDLVARMRGLIAEFESRIDSLEQHGRAMDEKERPVRSPGVTDVTKETGTALVDLSSHPSYSEEGGDAEEAGAGRTRGTGT